MVATVAIPLALIERWGTAHFKVGWGDPLPSDTAWGKPLLEKAPFNLADPRLLARYHFVMFFVVVPAVLAMAILLFKGWIARPPATWIAWVLFIIACVLGVMELEDFLFFVFSSLFQAPYPHALARFFRGEANWHPRWINFGCFKLPDFYLWFPPLISFLIWLESRLG